MKLQQLLTEILNKSHTTGTSFWGISDRGFFFFIPRFIYPRKIVFRPSMSSGKSGDSGLSR
jgi:hypothetical protein